MSLKSVTGSGGAISAALCLRPGRRDGGEGGWGIDELVPDHACKLSPRGRVTSSCGMMGAAYSLSSCPASCRCRSHAERRFKLDRGLNHISAAWMSCLCTEAQTTGYQIKTQGPIFHSPFFISHHPFLFSQSLLAPFLSFRLALFLPRAPTLFSPLLPVSLRLLRQGDPGVSTQEPARWAVQTTGKMFHFFFSSTSSE